MRDLCWKGRAEVREAAQEEGTGASAWNNCSCTWAAPSASLHAPDSCEFPSATATVPRAS